MKRENMKKKNKRNGETTYIYIYIYILRKSERDIRLKKKN